ncbi:MAG: polysulfide reductase [Acidobacteria bacterium]|nr:polysulfide reductase [Acidobacteriota bacterium]NIM60664.1 polysulfide reductase [Acidobacteriota bacterium]NIO58624.1 polysulfide reductase [Acidobacteriota bacterium]NIQ29680.1 polysulfide reductase [Acidobacteriota bacterium]NIQ84397.1 polysulfide reductase [Acidobacteriota bacterium]
MLNRIQEFIIGSFKLTLKGNRTYHLWMAFLTVLVLSGAFAYYRQYTEGLIVTNMRDQVSWAFYIGNFTFLVGVAAAAVLLVIPAYVYNWKPIREIAIFGELLAISAIVMCLLFVTVDIGQPLRVLELLPVIGSLNVPSSLLGWDVLVLNGYLILNVVIVGHFLYKAYFKKPYNKAFVVPLLLLSIPAAISIHTVTAFVYNGMAARPFWNASILAPRFIASAFCSGPAVMLILFQILRRTTHIRIRLEAIRKIAELMAYAMFLNLFLFGAEIFKEYYSDTDHLAHTEYLYSGLHGHTALVPFAWVSLICSVVAFILFLVPKTRMNMVTLNLGCILIWSGVYIEKGMALVIPGMTPDTLGEIYEYIPTWTEIRIGAGVFAIGFMVFTMLCKVAIPLLHDTLADPVAPGEPYPEKL